MIAGKIRKFPKLCLLDSAPIALMTVTIVKIESEYSRTKGIFFPRESNLVVRRRALRTHFQESVSNLNFDTQTPALPLVFWASSSVSTSLVWSHTPAEPTATVGIEHRASEMCASYHRDTLLPTQVISHASVCPRILQRSIKRRKSVGEERITQET